jgi:hypothetical protein
LSFDGIWSDKQLRAMHPIEDFSLSPLTQLTPRARLMRGGQALAELDGAVLEAQYCCSHGYLLVTADGDPDEELLHFHLMSTTFEALDRVSLGQMYTPGDFRRPIVKQGEVLEFSFFAEERWRLTVLPSRKRMLPLPFSPVRRALLRAHLLALVRL